MVNTRVLSRKIILSKTFDIYNFKYKPPIKKDLAVCFVYFNAAKSKRILMNYLYVVEKLKIADIPFFTIEMFITTPEIKDAVHLKTDCILFQKERMTSILEKYIPSSFTKLVFLDADLIFDNMNWYNDLSKALNHYTICHVFTKCLRLDITYSNIMDERLSFVIKRYLNHKKEVDGIPMFPDPINGDVKFVGKDKIQFVPGGGWGFQRDWFKKIGFFEDDILGGSDTYSVQSWNIIPDNYVYPQFIKNSIQKYKKLIAKNGSPSVTYLKGNVYHLWHGDLKKKQYKTRKNIFTNVKDIKDIIKPARNGLFELKNKTLKKRLCTYFEDRDDDGI